jgi:hypothetical protein
MTQGESEVEPTGKLTPVSVERQQEAQSDLNPRTEADQSTVYEYALPDPPDVTPAEASRGWAYLRRIWRERHDQPADQPSSVDREEDRFFGPSL